jgi:hypothetical protein
MTHWGWYEWAFVAGRGIQVLCVLVMIVGCFMRVIDMRGRYGR